MIILGWILLIMVMIAFEYLSTQNKYKEVKKFVKVYSWWIILVFVFTIFILLRITLDEVNKPEYATPTILICNSTTVAESSNGFAFNSKSGTYEDYRSSLTYTPRQGEVCKQYLKGNK